MDQSGVPMGLKVVKARDLREMIEGFDAIVVMNDLLLERERVMRNRVSAVEAKLAEAQEAKVKPQKTTPVTERQSYHTRLEERRKKRSEKERLLKVRKVEY